MSLTPRAGQVIWMTGLSGSGKSTIGKELGRRLRQHGVPVVMLDGDVLRRGLCSDLGFSNTDRRENVRRAGEVAALLSSEGVAVIAALISPFRVERERVRCRVGSGNFLEVFVNAPIHICESRDVKGLYRRARAGDVTEFTGISSPYQRPEYPDIEVQTDIASLDDCVDAILSRAFPPLARAESNRRGTLIRHGAVDA